MMHMHHDSPEAPCACTALRKAARAVSRTYDEALARQGMTTTQFAILRHVERGAPLPLSRLAEQLVMDRTSLYRALAPIEARGWISVTPGPGRSRMASLTAAGRHAIDAAEADWRRVQPRIVDGMGGEGWTALQAALRAITDIAQEQAK